VKIAIVSTLLSLALLIGCSQEKKQVDESEYYDAWELSYRVNYLIRRTQWLEDQFGRVLSHYAAPKIEEACGPCKPEPMSCYIKEGGLVTCHCECDVEVEAK